MRCLITFEKSKTDYSAAGLRALNRNLDHLNPLAYSADEQVKQAVMRSGKMSVQGVQPKLSAVLNISEASFELVDQFGHYIIKPQHRDYPFMPENEALTMRLAQVYGLEVPMHGLLRSADDSLSYLVKRFDRLPGNQKQHVEDFAQVTGQTRTTKYESSMEQVASALECCTFPLVSRFELFKRCLFHFVTGNEDMHLKNFSVIYRSNKRELSPNYDLLNSTVIWRLLGRSQNEIEELALPIAGKRRKLKRTDWIDYFAKSRLELNDNAINRCLHALKKAVPEWEQLIRHSFLPEDGKQLYLEILNARLKTLLE